MRRTLAAAACLLMFSTFAGAKVIGYVPKDLGIPSGCRFATPFAINDRGQIAGYVLPLTAPERAFLWEPDGQGHVLPVPGGVRQSRARAINNNGQVVGDIGFGDDSPERAVIWNPDGSMVDLTSLCGWDSVTAFDINNLGQVAGSALELGDPAFRFGFLWSPSSGAIDVTQSIPGGAQSWVFSINDRGWVAGSYAVGMTGSRAFIWTENGLVDIGSRLGNGSTAWDVNNSGQAAGAVSGNGPFSWNTTPVFWDSDGTLYDLGMIAGGGSGQARAINDAGQVIAFVSSAQLKPTPVPSWHVAFMWSKKDGIIPLLPLAGFRQARAYGINRWGQVAGECIGEFSAKHPSLWTPVIQVAIRLKDTINLKSHGVVPVAVLTTDDFDAATIDPATVEFAEAKPVKWTTEDVNSDGRPDMLFHLRTQELNLTATSTEATLTGAIKGGQNYIEGKDSIRISPKQ